MRMSVWLVTSLMLAGAAPWAFGATSGASGGDHWVEGTHYLLLQSPQPTSVPAGKVEVTEVFSYACPACNHFYPVVNRLKASLPANAVVDFVPASFIPTEDWPMFQRAYYTALILGVETQHTHDAMFDAVWKT